MCILVCSGTSIEKAAYIIASGGKFREPKVTSWIRLCCAEIGNKAFFDPRARFRRTNSVCMEPLESLISGCVMLGKLMSRWTRPERLQMGQLYV